MEFNERLKSLRKKANLTQTAFADDINVHVQTVSKWECGATLPDFATYDLIAKRLNVSIEELWGVDAPQNACAYDFVSVEATGNSIRVIRKELNLTQAEFAERLDVSDQQISKWERGLIAPPPEKIIEIANLVGITPSIIYYGQVNPKPLPKLSDKNAQAKSLTKDKQSKNVKPKIYVICAIIVAIMLTAVVFAVVKCNKERANNLEDTYNGAVNYVEDTAFYYPVFSEQSIVYRKHDEFFYNSTLNNYSLHQGVDLTAEKGDKVVAVIGGIIIETADGVGSVKIASTQGYTVVISGFNLNEELAVGDTVSAGQVIGTIEQGIGLEYKEGEHLHVEFYLNENIIDPLLFLPSSGSEKWNK